MNKINFLIDTVKSVVCWFLIAILVLIFFGPVLLMVVCLYPFDPARKAIHPLISTWAKLMLVVCPLMNVHVEGEESLNREGIYILVSNHQSIADIIVALHLRQSFKFIAKKELFLIPFFGWAMTLAGYIPLVRGNRHSGQKAVTTARDFIEQGASVLFFPEGTRSPDGEIHSFKTGAFKLAAETGMPIVPIVIDGTYNLVPKGSRLFSHNTKVRLKVLPPCQPAGKDNLSIKRLVHEVRSDMIEALSQIRSKKEIELTSVSQAFNLSS